jgi:predicted nuclease of predicted toxin-antitoxin system
LSAQPELKLLYDQNLPARFVTSLADLFPGSEHLKNVGLATANDRTVWDYAGKKGFAIISKDSDFHQMSFLYGAPPKAIWRRCGSCSVAELETIIRQDHGKIKKFMESADEAFLVIGAQ